MSYKRGDVVLVLFHLEGKIGSLTASDIHGAEAAIKRALCF